MSVIPDALRVESDRTLSFGDYVALKKIKVNEFKNDSDLYDLRTYKEITRLQKNGSLLFESVPGATVHNFFIDEKLVKFGIEGFDDTQITLELEPNKEYRIIADDINMGSTLSNVSGKVSFSIPLTQNIQAVRIEKV